LTEINNGSNGSVGIFAGILTRIETVCNGLNMAVVFAMMLVVVYGVLTRYVFNISVNWVAEVSEFMMVSLSFLTIGAVQSKRKHVTVTALIDKWGLKTQTVLRVITTMFSLLLFALLTWAAWRFALKALQAGFVSDVAEIPLFPFRLLVPVGGLLMCFRLVADLVQDIESLMGHGTLKPEI
jgi:C4-dicarboxylate transporter DctQ subunit